MSHRWPFCISLKQCEVYLQVLQARDCLLQWQMSEQQGQHASQYHKCTNTLITMLGSHKNSIAISSPCRSVNNAHDDWSLQRYIQYTFVNGAVRSGIDSSVYKLALSGSCDSEALNSIIQQQAKSILRVGFSGHCTATQSVSTEHKNWSIKRGENGELGALSKRLTSLFFRF